MVNQNNIKKPTYEKPVLKKHLQLKEVTLRSGCGGGGGNDGGNGNNLD